MINTMSVSKAPYTCPESYSCLPCLVQAENRKYPGTLFAPRAAHRHSNTYSKRILQESRISWCRALRPQHVRFQHTPPSTMMSPDAICEWQIFTMHSYAFYSSHIPPFNSIKPAPFCRVLISLLVGLSLSAIHSSNAVVQCPVRPLVRQLQPNVNFPI